MYYSKIFVCVESELSLKIVLTFFDLFLRILRLYKWLYGFVMIGLSVSHTSSV